MITLPLEQRLEILADSAKYDVSCSSSGSSRGGKAGSLGSTASSGICHTWTADGRCISLLKILLTNACIYDCAYCTNQPHGPRPPEKTRLAGHGAPGYEKDFKNMQSKRTCGPRRVAERGKDSIKFKNNGKFTQ